MVITKAAMKVYNARNFLSVEHFLDFLFFLELFHEKLRKGVFRSLNGSFACLCDAQVSFHIYIGNEHTFPRSEIELAGAPPYAW